MSRRNLDNRPPAEVGEQVTILEDIRDHLGAVLVPAGTVGVVQTFMWSGVDAGRATGFRLLVTFDGIDGPVWIPEEDVQPRLMAGMLF